MQSITSVGCACLALLLTSPALLRPAAAQWVEDNCASLLEEVGTQPDALFGFLVEAIGDADNDGVTDFVATSPFHDAGQSSVGRVSAHSGADGSLLWSRTGARLSEIHGFALATVPDLTDDGVLEVLAGGGWNRGLPAGQVKIYDGATGSPVRTWTGPVEFDTYGHSVATGGDFDGNGVLDIAFSAPGVDTHGNNAGEVRVYSSDDFSLVAVIAPVRPKTEGKFGNGLEFLGDVNGDGRDDLAIGARIGVSWDPPGSIHVIAYDGKEPHALYAIEDVNHGGAFDGDLIESGYDYDGDGRNDILFGQWSISEAVLFSGADGSLIHTFTGDGSDELFGTGKMIPDVSGDGQPDLVISGWGNDIGGQTAGRVYVYDGADFSIIRTMTPTSAGWKFGTGISCMGDYDHDGVLDFLIGAPGTSFQDTPLGRVFVMKGVGVAREGDINGDGAVDFDDLVLLLHAWGPCQDCPEDIDGDGDVDFDDLVRLLANWD